MMTTQQDKERARWCRIGVSLILLLGVFFEYYLFRYYVIKNIVPVYPMGIDQANYLYASYKLYENSLQQGFISALQQHPLTPTSYLFTVQAAVFFLLFGASRLSALSLNFLYFALLQVCAFYTIKFCTGRYSLAFLFIGLVLSTQIFLNYGGAVDFRIDFMALCTYGMWVCAVLRSNVFFSKKWTLISAGLAILLVSMRFLTVIYVTGIVGTLYLYYLIQWFYQKKSMRLMSSERLKNIILFGVMVSVVIAPLLWIHRELLFSYYVYGHVLGPEKWARAKFVGITSAWTNVMFYPRVLWNGFLSFQTIVEIGLMLVFFVIFSQAFPGQIKAKQVDLSAFIFLSLCVLLPLIFLTMDMSKSTIVPGIVTVPFLLGIIWVCWFCSQKIAVSRRHCMVEWMMVVCCSLSGGGYYAQMLHARGGGDFAAIHRLLNDIGDYAKTTPHVYAAEDKYTDFFAAIPAFYYETHHILLDFTSLFGAYSQVIVPNSQVALEDMARLNVFVSSLGPFTPNSWLLFEKSIAGFRPILREMAAKRMEQLGRYRIRGIDYVVYVAAL